jgi:hypothetical protein
MKEYETTTTSMGNCDEMLTAATRSTDQGLHIVGAMAIEDKLHV